MKYIKQLPETAVFLRDEFITSNEYLRTYYDYKTGKKYNELYILKDIEVY